MDARSGATVGNEYDTRKLADASARSNVQHEKILPPLPLRRTTISQRKQLEYPLPRRGPCIRTPTQKQLRKNAWQ